MTDFTVKKTNCPHCETDLVVVIWRETYFGSSRKVILLEIPEVPPP